MKLRNLILSALAASAAFASISHALRQDEGGAMEFPSPKPGPEHEVLKMMEGEWTAKVSMMGQESTGTMTNTMEMNGLWLVSRYEGEMMGSEFTGLGLLSYDAASEKYVGTWVDSMTTALEPSRGTYDKAKKELTMDQAGVDPMSGERITMTQVTTIKDRDHHTFNMKMPGPDGTPMEGFTIEYTRKK